jgi:hypothetical protein
MKWFVIVIGCMIMLMGCAERKKWTKPGLNSHQFSIDSAQCEIYSNNVADSSAPAISNTPHGYNSSTSGYYDNNSGQYYQNTKVTAQRSPFTPLLNSIAHSNTTNKSYNLCMQSKGYQAVSKRSSKTSRVTRAGLVDNYNYNECDSSYDCATGYYCGNGLCLKTPKTEGSSKY